MTCCCRWCLLLCVYSTPGLTSAAEQVLEEAWEVAEVEGARVGHVHTLVQRTTSAPPGALRSSSDLQLTFRRGRAVVRLRMEQGAVETDAGKVLGVFMRQYHGEQKRLELLGQIEPGEEGRMHVVVDAGRIERHVRWSDEVVSLYRLEKLLQKRRPLPGEQLKVAMYEPTVNCVLDLRVEVRAREAHVLDGRRVPLLRVEMTPEKLETTSGPLQLPGLTWWLDDDYLPVRREVELAGLGKVVTVRSSRERALAPIRDGAPAPDIGLKTLIPLNRRLTNPHGRPSARYRIRVAGDQDVASVLKQDDHQEIRSATGRTLELVVQPPREPTLRPVSRRADPEFLASCPFIDWDQPRVRQIARQAAGGEQDPWRKALRLEQWVHQRMTSDNAAPLASASQVAASLRGDCRHHAFLTAALCRAEGIPSRTAIGLLYVEKNARPYLGFHMWTEVWIDGGWVGLDSTLGRGGVGAGHVKITDHGWHDTRSLTPLLPLASILGKLEVEIAGE